MTREICFCGWIGELEDREPVNAGAGEWGLGFPMCGHLDRLEAWSDAARAATLAEAARRRGIAVESTISRLELIGPIDAEDAWSETFLAALRAYPALRAGSNVKAWLITIAHRKAIDQTRARARRPIPVDSLPERPAPSEEHRWDGDLWSAMQALPFKQRVAVAYHYVAGMPYADVAALTGGSQDAARRAAADGIATLRKTCGEGDAR